MTSELKAALERKCEEFAKQHQLCGVTNLTRGGEERGEMSETIFSPDRKYRYTLYREWEMPLHETREGYAMFIGLNPSTADETKDDPTIRRCKGFAKSWGFARMYMLNLFAFRATKPRDMMGEPQPVGEENDKYLTQYARRGFVIAAWGRHGEFMGRNAEVLSLLDDVHQIGEAGYPRHPLYLPKNLQPAMVVRP